MLETSQGLALQRVVREGPMVPDIVWDCVFALTTLCGTTWHTQASIASCSGQGFSVAIVIFHHTICDFLDFQIYAFNAWNIIIQF